jgi:hypothetical protein
VLWPFAVNALDSALGIALGRRDDWAARAEPDEGKDQANV